MGRPPPDGSLDAPPLFPATSSRRIWSRRTAPGRAARTRPQWAKLLETPTLLVVALRRGRRVAQLGPRSPDYLSSEAVYASLADLRSRRLAEMDGFLANRDRELDPELLNRAQRRRCGYKQSDAA